MLDEFIPPKPESKAPSIPSGPGRPDAPLSIEGLTDNDFAQQLQAGMADLLGDLETSPDMQAQFESMLKGLGGATGAAAISEPGVAPQLPSSSKPNAASSSTAAAEETFQETIKKTMERMQASGESATAAAGSAGQTEEDLLAEMLKAMQSSELDGEGAEEDFSKMLLGMMEQLTNKEILYEPMKELDDKFPAWMEKNSASQAEDDLKRYKEQQTYVKEIVARFEAKGYSDDNADDREYIVDRMQKLSLPSI
jgi:peroxin-19